MSEASVPNDDSVRTELAHTSLAEILLREVIKLEIVVRRDPSVDEAERIFAFATATWLEILDDAESTLLLVVAI
jgi:hypothetical protein